MKITDTIRYAGVNDHQIDLSKVSTKYRTVWHIIPM